MSLNPEMERVLVEGTVKEAWGWKLKGSMGVIDGIVSLRPKLLKWKDFNDRTDEKTV